MFLAILRIYRNLKAFKVLIVANGLTPSASDRDGFAANELAPKHALVDPKTTDLEPTPNYYRAKPNDLTPKHGWGLVDSLLLLAVEAGAGRPV